MPNKNNKKKRSIVIRETEDTSENMYSDKAPTKGDKILSRETRTETEEIDNGWLVIKTTEVRYRSKNGEGTKYYSKTDKAFSDKEPFLKEDDGKELADFF